MAIKIYELCGADETLLFSPHCWKTRMSIAHKGLAFETVPTPFTIIPKVEEGVSKTVPVIRDGPTVVAESYEIAKYLDRAYRDRPSLFKGEGSEALTQFVISWSQTQLHPLIGQLAVKDIHDVLAPEDQAYFRKSREMIFGKTLEEVHGERDGKQAAFVKALFPLENMLKRQPFIGGETPLFADYVVFGALQWLRLSCSLDVLPQEGEVAAWFERLLDMYDGMGRRARAA